MNKPLAALVIAAFCASALAAEELGGIENDTEWDAVALGIAAPVQTSPAENSVYGFRFGGFYAYNSDVCGLDVGVAQVTSGDFDGLQLSAFNWAGYDSTGLRLGVFGNVSDGNHAGIHAGLVNVVMGEVLGAQLGALCYGGAFYGAQFGLLANWNSFVSCGWQTGILNYNQEKFAGMALGVFNLGEKVSWVQLGAVNTAYEVKGVQIGVLNACDELCGVQIGVLNIVDSSPLPIMPVVNASF